MPQSSAALLQKKKALATVRESKRLQHPQGPKIIRGVGFAIMEEIELIHHPRQIRWAKKPYLCAKGACVAVELCNGVLFVLVKCTDGHRAWHPASQVLSIEASKIWAKTGFC